MGTPRRALAVGALALMAGALCFTAAAAAAAASPASPYPAVELTPSVMLLGEFDWVPEYPGARSSRWERASRQGCDGVRRRGQRGLDGGEEQACTITRLVNALLRLGHCPHRCTNMVDRAVKYGSSRINFVPSGYGTAARISLNCTPSLG